MRESTDKLNHLKTYHLRASTKYYNTHAKGHIYLKNKKKYGGAAITITLEIIGINKK